VTREIVRTLVSRCSVCGSALPSRSSGVDCMPNLLTYSLHQKLVRLREEIAKHEASTQ
jgi:hypothetical protein